MIISQLRPDSLYVMLNMALLSGSSLIYTQSADKALSTFPFNPAKEILQEEVSGRLYRKTGPDGGVTFNFTREVKVVGRLRQDAIPLNLIHARNYYHFLIEWLPSFAHLLDLQAVTQDSIVVTGLLHRNMSDALNFILGDLQLPILQLRPMQMVMCDKVLATPPSSHAAALLTGGLTDYTYDAANIRRLRRRFAPLWAGDADASRRKLYVRRVSTMRHLTNAEEVEALAVEAGYEIVEPEQMSFFEQVRLFAGASHIMGPTGAWAANLLFAPPTAKVDIFYGAKCKVEKSLWAMLGQCFGMTVNDVYCPITHLNERHPIHSDYHVPAELCHDLLHERA
jgi:hypothetical protein